MTASGLSDVRDKAHVSGSLLDAVLRRAGVEPIPDELVSAYMKEKLALSPASNILGRLFHRLGMKHGIMEGLSVFVMVLGGAALFVIGLLLVAGFWFFFGGIPVLSIWPVGIGAGSIVSWFVLVDLSRKNHWQCLGPAYWSFSAAEVYGMPYSVILAMNQIRHTDPEVRFEVADLRQNDYSLDPVLFAIKGQERRAVKIWLPNGKQVYLS